MSQERQEQNRKIAFLDRRSRLPAIWSTKAYRNPDLGVCTFVDVVAPLTVLSDQVDEDLIRGAFSCISGSSTCPIGLLWPARLLSVKRLPEEVPNVLTGKSTRAWRVGVPKAMADA